MVRHVLFRYTTKGALKEIVDSRGETLYVNTDCQGRVEKIFRRANSKDIPLVGYHYDSSGNMISTEDSFGTRKFFYYVGHQLVKLTNQSGMSFHWEYDGEGESSRCIHTWGDDGVMEYHIEYGDGFTRTTNGLGHTTEYYYHDNKLIYKIIDANGGITRQHYNEFKELDVVVNPEGYSRRTVFNNFGLPVEITDENGSKTRLAYDGRRNLTSVITSTGRKTSWEYDEYDRVIKRTLPDGNSFSYTYEGGALKTITDMEGRVYTLKFNSRQELQQLVFPNGIHRTWEYDERGRLVKATDVKGNVTSYSYDDADNLIRLHEPDGNVHEFSYDTSGNLIVASDRLRKVEFEYGPLGTLIGRRQLDHHVRFRYDGELQLREIINEGGECYSFRLDGLGRVVEETGFDGLQRKYLRDGAGRVIRVVRPEGRQTDYEYDGVGNILQETQHDGRTSRFAYDEDGRLLRAENKEIKVAFKHDLGGRIVKETQGGHCIMRKYERTGRHVHTESSLGASIDYSHDKDGNLSEMNSGGWSARWQRDRVGLETERELTGGVHVKTHHDSLGRETYKSVGARNVEQFRRSYTWGIGNRLHATEDGLTGRRVRYDYDEFDNLLSAEYKQGNDVERIYRIPDRIGNLFETREKDDRKYDAGGRLTEDRDYFYHYDCEGNLVFKEFKEMALRGGIIAPINRERLETELGITFRAFGTGWRYDWQSDGMLAHVVRPDGKEVSFAYDALGRRIRKTYAGTTTRFVWDGNVPLHEWTEEAEESMVTWLFEQDTFVPAAKLVANGECFSIISDYLGTPLQAYDKQGNKVWEQELDIYGRQRKRPSAFIPFKYQGQYEDAETGLYYNRFRYYDPNAGSYISQDPIGLAGGSLILYMYVSNSNNLIDPFGLSRRGNQATRDHIEVVKDKFMSDNPGATHIGGGLDDAGNQMKEVYIRPSKPIPGSTKGGSYTDLTFKTADGKIVHINTVDKGNFNGMSKREFTNLNRIKADAPDTVVIAIGKGDDPGDLSMNKAKTSSH